MKSIKYYIMRHASYYDHDNQFVTYNGMLNLKQSMSDFLNDFNENFPGKKLRIVHSTLPRAKHTVLLMKEMLFSINIFTRYDQNLNSDRLQINEVYVKNLVSSCDKDNEICLILSHQPDIEFFCERQLRTSQWVSMSIDIEEIPALQNENDDLPF